MKKSILSLILAVVFAFGATEGVIGAFASVEADNGTPVAEMENDETNFYNDVQKSLFEKDKKQVANNISNEVNAMGGYVGTYASEAEYAKAQESESIKSVNAYEAPGDEIVQQIVKIMTTETGNASNNNYVESQPVANAIVRINGIPRYTDRNGEIKAMLTKNDYVQLFVEKEGYNPYIEVMEVTGDNKEIHIKQPSDDIDIYAAILDYDGDSINLLNQSYGIDLYSQDDTQKAVISIMANVNLDRVILFNNGKEIMSTENQKFTDINLCQFAVGDVLSIVGEASNIKSKELTLDLDIVNTENLNIADFIGIEEDDKDINLDNKAQRDGGSMISNTLGVLNFGINVFIRSQLNKKGNIRGKEQKERFVTVVYDNKHKKLKAIVGIDLYKSKSNGTIPGEFALMSRESTLESYRNFQRSFNNTKESRLPGGKNITGIINGFQTIRKPGNFKTEFTKGIQTDITLYGFIEFDCSQGLKLSDIGLTIDLDFAATIAGTFMVWSIPCYWYATLGVDFNFSVHKKNIDNLWKTIINIDPTVYARIGVGVGINGIASVGGALQADIDINNEYMFTDYSDDINSSGYFHLKSWMEIYFLFYSGRFFEREWVNAELWDTWKDKGIEQQGKPSTEGEISLHSLRNSLNSSKSLYYELAESRPQIVSINDTEKLVVWVGDDSLRSESNFTQLYYAIISNGKIGEPQVVCNDGTADFLPTLINNNGEIYLAWQNCNKIFDENATVLEVSSSLDIAVAKYDLNSNKFIDITNITNNNQLDAVPKFASVNGKLILGWQSNSESNLFFNSGKNYIYQSIFNGVNWSAPQMMLSTDSVIVDYDISILNNNSIILYNLDMDSDLSTMDDRQVFINSSSREALVEGVNLPKFENYDGELGVYYIKEGKLYYISDVTCSNLSIEQVTGNKEHVTEYRIIDNKSVLYSTSRDELRLAFNTDNKWNYGAKVCEFATGQLNYYDATSEDGKVSIIYLKNENSIFYLDCLDYEICYDIAIQNVMVPYAFNLEKSNEITIFVRNDGAFPIYNFEILVDGISEKVVALETPIMPSDIFAYEYNLNINEFKEIIIGVKLLDSIDVNQENNFFNLKTKVGELALTSVQNINNVLYYTLVNYSDFDISMEISIELKNYTKLQIPLVIGKGEQIVVDIDIEELLLDVYGENEICVKFDVETDIELLSTVSSTDITLINIKKSNEVNFYYDSLNISKSMLCI